MTRRGVLLVALSVGMCVTQTKEASAQAAVSVSFRNVLRQGRFVAQFEQLDAQGAVVRLVTQRVENGAIGTISVNPGTRFNIRLLPDGGGGHVFSNRDLAADAAENGRNPIDLDGRFDASGRRVAIVMRLGVREIAAPRMEYDTADIAGPVDYYCDGRSRGSWCKLRGLFSRRCGR
jgi:hypothetical protein